MCAAWRENQDTKGMGSCECSEAAQHHEVRSKHYTSRALAKRSWEFSMIMHDHAIIHVPRANGSRLAQGVTSSTVQSLDPEASEQSEVRATVGCPFPLANIIPRRKLIPLFRGLKIAFVGDIWKWPIPKPQQSWWKQWKKGLTPLCHFSTMISTCSPPLQAMLLLALGNPNLLTFTQRSSMKTNRTNEQNNKTESPGSHLPRVVQPFPYCEFYSTKITKPLPIST